MIEQVQAFLDIPYLFPYVLALGIMFGIAVIEVVTAIVGVGVFSFVDTLLPDLDLDLDVDLPVHLSAVSFLHVGRVPLSILLVCFLTIFGLVGVCLHKWLFHGLTNLVVLPITLVISTLLLNRVGAFLSKIIPSTETYVVSDNDLLGSVATIILGETTIDRPTSAAVKDKHGERHKIMVIPFNDGDVFKKGQKVLLVDKSGSYFQVTNFDV